MEDFEVWIVGDARNIKGLSAARMERQRDFCEPGDIMQYAWEYGHVSG